MDDTSHPSPDGRDPLPSWIARNGRRLRSLFQSDAVCCIALTALALSISVLMFSSLPETVTIHWNMRGEADGTGNRIWLALAIPVVIAIHSMFAIALRRGTGAFKASIQARRYLPAEMLLLLVVHLTTLKVASGWRPTEPFYMSFFIGLLLVVFGVTMPRTKQNGFYGVRTEWTMQSPEVWRQTHEMAGKVFLWTGIACIFGGLVIDEGVAGLLSILAALFSSFFGADYSYRVAKRLGTVIAPK